MVNEKQIDVESEMVSTHHIKGHHSHYAMRVERRAKVDWSDGQGLPSNNANSFRGDFLGNLSL